MILVCPILFIFGSLRVLWANEVGSLMFNDNDEIDVLSFENQLFKKFHSLFSVDVLTFFLPTYVDI
jgi:hypothetical protein